MTEFYVTLFSNSSMDFYMENKTSSFTVQLPRRMLLNGDWRVALSEIQYPYTFLNVQKGQNEIKIKAVLQTQDVLNFLSSDDKITTQSVESKFGGEWITCEIEPGFYSDTVNLISSVNNAIAGATGRSTFFELDKQSQKVKAVPPSAFELNQKLIIYVKMSDRLSLQLGYIPNRLISAESSNALHPVNLISGIPDKMLIYCDIIEPQLCGDKCAKVLRTVTVTPDRSEPYFGYPCCKNFTQLQYIPLQLKHFESISIDIRSITSEFIPFQFGTSSVELHFKQF